MALWGAVVRPFADRQSSIRCKGALMAQFTVNPQRFDPYKDFKFRVKWDGHYVAGFQALPALDADADAVAIQSIKLENEGWERDTSVKEPVEPG